MRGGLVGVSSSETPRESLVAAEGIAAQPSRAAVSIPRGGSRRRLVGAHRARKSPLTSLSPARGARGVVCSSHRMRRRRERKRAGGGARSGGPGAGARGLGRCGFGVRGRREGSPWAATLEESPRGGALPGKPWLAEVSQCRPRWVGCAARKLSSPAARCWSASCRLSGPRRRLEEVFVNGRSIFNYRWWELQVERAGSVWRERASRRRCGGPDAGIRRRGPRITRAAAQRRAVSSWSAGHRPAVVATAELDAAA